MLLRFARLAPVALVGCVYVQSYPAPEADEPPTLTVPAAAPACGSADDPDNCGTCGHSCLGGACTAGACEPVMLASDQGDTNDQFYGAGPVDLATDGAHVYWLTGLGDVMRVPTAGGAVEHVAAAPSGSMRLRLDRDDVFFTGDRHGRVFRAPKRGGDAAALTPPSSDVIYDFLVAWGRIYWTAQPSEPLVDDWPVRSCSRDGCGTDAPYEVWSSGRATLLVTNATRLFMSGYDATTHQPWITGVNPQGHGNGQVKIGAGWVVSLAADDRDVFVGAEDELRRAPAMGSAPGTVIASGEAYRTTYTLELDGDDVYFANTRQSIARCSRRGCIDPEVIVTDPQAKRIAMKDDAIYFITFDGRVMKVAKPARPAKPFER